MSEDSTLLSLSNDVAYVEEVLYKNLDEGRDGMKVIKVKLAKQHPDMEEVLEVIREAVLASQSIDRQGSPLFFPQEEEGEVIGMVEFDLDETEEENDFEPSSFRVS